MFEVVYGGLRVSVRDNDVDGGVERLTLNHERGNLLPAVFLNASTYPIWGGGGQG